MESGRMVMMHRMAKFMQQNEIAQMFRQSHQKKAQRYGIPARAASPLRPRNPNRHTGILQSGLPCKPFEASWQVGFRRTTQFFDTCFRFIRRQQRFDRRPGRNPLPSTLDPCDFALQELQCLPLRYPTRIGQSHCPAPPHANRNMPRPCGLHAFDFAQNGMLHRVITSSTTAPAHPYDVESRRSTLRFRNNMRTCLPR